MVLSARPGNFLALKTRKDKDLISILQSKKSSGAAPGTGLVGQSEPEAGLVAEVEADAAEADEEEDEEEAVAEAERGVSSSKSLSSFVCSYRLKARR